MALERVEQRFSRERSLWRAGLLLSLLIHLLLLLIFRTSPERLTPYAAAGPAAGDPVAAPGGGGMRAVVLRPPVEIKVPPKPETPIVKPVEVLPEEPILSFSDLEIPKPGEGKIDAPEIGPGTPGGEGKGDAGNAMTGLRRLIPPTPRGVIMAPLARPPSVRGKEVTVWVFVNAAGSVDSVRLEPPTADGGYNDNLIRNAHNWVFEPAERAGRPVASWWNYTWKL